MNRILRLDDEAVRALDRQSGVSHGSVRPQLCVYFLFSIIVLLILIKVIYTIVCVITDRPSSESNRSKRRQQLASASRRAITATRSLVDRTTTSKRLPFSDPVASRLWTGTTTSSGRDQWWRQNRECVSVSVSDISPETVTTRHLSLHNY